MRGSCDEPFHSCSYVIYIQLVNNQEQVLMSPNIFYGRNNGCREQLYLLSSMPGVGFDWCARLVWHPNEEIFK